MNQIDENKFSETQIAARNAIQQSFQKLDYILKLMDKSQVRAINKKSSVNKTYVGLDGDLIGQTIVHAESFYCEAHRLKKQLHDKLGFPVFKKEKFIRVTLVRNKLVEHPEINLDVSAWGTNVGPVLYAGNKSLDKKHPKMKDMGFYPNAKEFYSELIKILEAAAATPILRDC